jgi:endo-1,4-beta-xylanase
MNRFIVFSFSCVMLVGLTVAQDSSAPKADEPTITAIEGTPEIDGKIDQAWKEAPRVEVIKAVDALLTIDGDKMATASVRVLWDADHVYALWQVKDANLSAQASDPWAQDSVEIFLDENQKRTAWYESDDAQYRVSCEGTLSGQGTGFDQSNLKAAARKTKNGYVVEMSIKIQEAKLESGRKLGVELQVNDDPGTGERGAVAKWNHTEDDSWEDTSNFGTLLLQ